MQSMLLQVMANLLLHIIYLQVGSSVLRRFYILNGIASLIIISPFAMTVCKNGSRVNFVAGSTLV